MESKIDRIIIAIYYRLLGDPLLEILPMPQILVTAHSIYPHPIKKTFGKSMDQVIWKVK